MFVFKRRPLPVLIICESYQKNLEFWAARQQTRDFFPVSFFENNIRFLYPQFKKRYNPKTKDPTYPPYQLGHIQQKICHFNGNVQNIDPSKANANKWGLSRKHLDHSYTQL